MDPDALIPDTPLSSTTMFPNFNKLPTELRLEIWHLTLPSEPQTFSIAETFCPSPTPSSFSIAALLGPGPSIPHIGGLNEDLKAFRKRHAPPKALSVCSESRGVALNHGIMMKLNFPEWMQIRPPVFDGVDLAQYDTGYGQVPTQHPGLWFRPALDTIFLDWWALLVGGLQFGERGFILNIPVPHPRFSHGFV